MVEWIPGYHGGHEHTFSLQYRIINECKTWFTQQIPQYDKQTYTLQGLQADTWYELWMFAEKKFDRSSVTDIQGISTVPPLKKGMYSNVSSFCFLTLSICCYPKVGGRRYHISDRLAKIMLILKWKRRYLTYCSWCISGITFIMCTHYQTIGKTNNSKDCERTETKD